MADDTQFNASLHQLRSLTRSLAEHLVNLTHAAPATTEGCDSELRRSYSHIDIDSQLGGFHSQLGTIQAQLDSTRLSVAVLALAKSGKSTLLNALIGRDMLPSNNVPETARIVRIHHCNDPAQEALYETRASANPPLQRTVSIDAIRTRLEQLNQEHRATPWARADDLELEIATRIVGLDHARSSGGAAPAVKLELVDTPGPNEAGEERLRQQVVRMLGSSVDAVLYVLDYTKLKTAEEAAVLTSLKAENPQLVQRLSSRLFFVVNKCDALHTEAGLSDEETRAYVAHLITQHMAMPEFQLLPHQVLLISAREALLARLHLLGHASPRDRQALVSRAFGRFGAPPTERQLIDAATRMLQASGMPELENTVLSFLYAKAGTLKLQAIADALTSLLGQLANVYATHEGALRYDCAALVDKAAALQKELQATLAGFDDVQSRATDMEGLVTDALTHRMDHLKHKLHERVRLALHDHDPPAGRWLRVWRSAKALFTAAPSGDRGALEHMLRELADDVTLELGEEVSHFWRETETQANEQQRVLFASLNSHIRRVAKAVEGQVEGALEVQLQPVDLSLEPPSPEQFHLDLQALLNAGMVRHTHEEHVHNKCGKSLCRFFSGRDCEACRQAQYVRLVETYEVSPERVQTFFINAIDEAVSTSSSRVRGVVRKFLASQVQQARGHLVSYCERYSGTMLRAIDTSRQGEAARQLELQRLAAARAAVSDLQSQLHACMRHLAPPGVHAAMHETLMAEADHLDGDVGHNYFSTEGGAAEDLQEDVQEDGKGEASAVQELPLPEELPMPEGMARGGMRSLAPDSLSDALGAGVCDSDDNGADDNGADDNAAPLLPVGVDSSGPASPNAPLLPVGVDSSGTASPNAPLLMVQTDAASVDIPLDSPGRAAEDAEAACLPSGSHCFDHGHPSPTWSGASSVEEWQVVRGGVGMPVAPNGEEAA